MPDRPRTSRRISPPTSAAERVRHLLATRWGGNQAQMARDVGCSQGALSKIANGLVDPGKRLLHLVASHPEVNAEWLLHGTGSILRETPPRLDRPVTSALAASVAELAPDAIRGSAEVPPSYSSETSYWLQLRSTDPIVAHGHRSLRPGDLLLVETARRGPDVAGLGQNLCVVRTRTGDESVLRLAEVTVYAEDAETGPAHLEADFFDPPAVPDGTVFETRRILSNGRWRDERSVFREVVDSTGRRRRLRVSARLSLPPLVEPEDVVGTVLFAVRPQP